MIEPAAREPFSGTVHVMPSPSALRAGAVWVTAANWAEASRRRWGDAWFLTPDSVFGTEQARAHASRPPASGTAGLRLRSAIPMPTKTLVKDLRALIRARKFRRSVNADAWNHLRIPFIWQHHDVFERAGIRLARVLSVPVLLFVDAPQVWEARRWGVRRQGWGHLMERYGEIPQALAADLVGCVSEEVAEVVASWGVPDHRILVLPCTADTQRFHTDISGAAVRERYGLSDAPVVGWVGSFRGFHAVDLLLEAVEAVQPQLGNARLLLVGDGAQRSSVMDRAVDLGIDAVFTGAVPHDEIPEHLAAMDVAVVTAREAETFHYSPLKLREYMASGRAIIAPRVGDVARTLTHGEDGLLYQPGDVEGFGQAITRFVGDHRLRQQLGYRAHAHYMQSGGPDAQLDIVMDALYG